jgi:hypothetical protein
MTVLPAWWQPALHLSAVGVNSGRPSWSGASKEFAGRFRTQTIGRPRVAPTNGALGSNDSEVTA